MITPPKDYKPPVEEIPPEAAIVLRLINTTSEDIEYAKNLPDQTPVEEVIEHYLDEPLPDLKFTPNSNIEPIWIPQQDYELL